MFDLNYISLHNKVPEKGLLVIVDVDSSHDNNYDDVSVFSSWPAASLGIQITNRLPRRSIVVFWVYSVELSALEKDRYAHNNCFMTLYI